MYIESIYIKIDLFWWTLLAIVNVVNEMFLK